MVSKRQREQRKNATAASLLWYKRQRLETPDNSTQLQSSDDCNSDEPSDTENTDDEATWFWNDSANESQSDSEEEGDCDSEEGDDSEEIEQSNTDEAIVSKRIELVWKEGGDKSLRGGYGNGSRSTRKRQRKKNKALEKEAAETYQIGALWQRQRASQAEQVTAASVDVLDDTISSSYPLSQVPRGQVSRPKREIRMKKRKESSKAIDKLLELVTEQEKKYGERLSPHNNLYRRHVMVHQFLHSQLTNPTGRIRKDLSMSVARCFGRGQETSRNIIRWENSWIDDRFIPERKICEYHDSWMDDKDLRESIQDFAKKQGDLLSSYKLVQYLKDQVTLDGNETPITIRSRTARRWLHKLGFEYKNVKKDVFVDGHERSDVVEDRESFLNQMKDLQQYLVEFDADGTMKPKEYPLDCAVGSDQRRPVIVITHDECTFSANNGKRRAWAKKGETFLRPKGRGQGIIVSDFLLPFGHLNLSSLSCEKKKEIVERMNLTVTEAAELFEYGKNHEGYWDGAKLHEQVISKALPIAEALYPGYLKGRGGYLISVLIPYP